MKLSSAQLEQFARDVTTTSYPLWTINHDTIRKLVERGGLVHASTSNLSPWNPVSVYLSLCAV
jgi:ectoine hydroxylase